MIRRRSTIIKAAALVCTAVVPKPLRAVIAGPTYPCGCARRRPGEEFDDCLVHDTAGKRWDAYTFEEIVRLNREEVTIVAEGDDIYCDAGFCNSLDELPAGTRGVWRQASYEYNEWAFRCARCERQEWLSVQTIDWYAELRELDK